MRCCVHGPAGTWAGRVAVLVLVGMMGCTRTPAAEELGAAAEEARPDTSEDPEPEAATVEALRSSEPSVSPITPLWVRRTVAPLEEFASHVAADPSRNAVVLFGFSETLDLGSGPIFPPPAQGFASAVGKFDEDGKLLWVRSVAVVPGTTTPTAQCENLVVDKWGNIILACTQRGLADYGAGPTIADIFSVTLVKWDRNGRLLWTRRVRIGIGGGRELIRLATDKWGHIAMAGTFEGSADFGGGLVTAPGTDNGSAFVARYSPSGDFEWLYLETHFPGSDVIAITGDDKGQFVIGGYVRLPTENVPFLAKLSKNGVPLWTRYLEGARGEIMDVAARGDRVVALGPFQGSFAFRGEVLSLDEDSYTFLVAYTDQGQEKWARTIDWGATHVALDSRHGALVIDGVPPSRLGLPGNISLARFDRRDGDLLEFRAFGTPGIAVSDVALTNEDELYLSGSFSGTVDFGLGTETSAGSGFRSVDAYLLKLDPEADAAGRTPEQARPLAH